MQSCSEDGVYVVTLRWKGGGGHATILQRINGMIYYVEPQVYTKGELVLKNINTLIQDLSNSPGDKRGVMRVDDKIFDAKYLSIFAKK